MKAIIKRKYILLDKKPKKFIQNGLRIIFSSSGWMDKTTLPRGTTDIKVNKRKYYFNLPEWMRVIDVQILRNGKYI